MNKKIEGEKWFDIGMGWLVKYQFSDTWLDFQVYKIISTNLDGSNGDMNDYAKGHVKWDGCMEIDRITNHYCGREDIQEFCDVAIELHKLCLILPSVDKECAGYAK